MVKKLLTLELPKLDNSVGDLDERSRYTHSADWPLFSYSQAGTWDRCKEKWYLRYRYNWTRKRSSFAMDVGTIAHDALQAYYQSRQEGMDVWMKEYLAENEDTQLEEISRAFFIVRIYTEKYAKKV